MDRVCAFCDAKPKTLPLLQCSRCKKVIYCDRDHQRSHWKTHKKACFPPGEKKVLEAMKIKAQEATVDGGDDKEEEMEIEQKEIEISPLLGDFFDADDFTHVEPEKVETNIGEDYGHCLSRETKLIKRYASLTEKSGLENEQTLKVAFELIHMWLNFYKLSPCNELIEEVWPACKAKFDDKSEQTWYVKAIQSRAFLRFKQFRYQEAIDLFQEQREIMGPSAQLCENMGHTYNRLGEYDRAEASFKEALGLIDDPNTGAGANKGGILLGFGSMLQKMGKAKQALAIHSQALAFYQKKYENSPHSLVAKSLVAVGSTLESLDQHDDACQKFEEAVDIYTKTVGEQTPLTANAVGCLGNALMKANKFERARKMLSRSFVLYVSFDTLDLIRVLDILKLIMTTHSKIGSGIDRSCYTEYVPGVKRLVANIKSQKIEEDGTGTLSVLLKTAAELAILGGELELTRPMLAQSKEYFETVKFLDCSNLVSTCDRLIAFIDKQKA